MEKVKRKIANSKVFLQHSIGKNSEKSVSSSTKNKRAIKKKLIRALAITRNNELNSKPKTFYELKLYISSTTSITINSLSDAFDKISTE